MGKQSKFKNIIFDDKCIKALEATSEASGVSIDTICSRSRTQECVEARWVLSLLLKDYHYRVVSALMGRTRTTGLFILNTAEFQVEHSKLLREMYDRALQILTDKLNCDHGRN